MCPVLRAAASAARKGPWEKDPQGLRGGSAWLLDAEGTERGAELKLDRQAGTCDLALSLTGKASPSSSQPSVRTFDSGSPRAFLGGGGLGVQSSVSRRPVEMASCQLSVHVSHPSSELRFCKLRLLFAAETCVSKRKYDSHFALTWCLYHLIL